MKRKLIKQKQAVYSHWLRIRRDAASKDDLIMFAYADTACGIITRNIAGEINDTLAQQLIDNARIEWARRVAALEDQA